MKEYRITKKECAEKIKGRVCSGCGRPVTPLETVDNSGDPTFWGGCEHCRRIDWGVSPELFKIAEMMVVEHRHIAYHHLDQPVNKDGIEYQMWQEDQIRGAVSTVSDVLACQKKVSGEKS